MFGRALKITIFDAEQSLASKKPVVVYEATATSAGSTGNLNVVMPSIVNGVFKDWPGPSGTTTRTNCTDEGINLVGFQGSWLLIVATMG